MSRRKLMHGQAVFSFRYVVRCLTLPDRCIFSVALCGVLINLVVFAIMHSWAVYDVCVLEPSGGWNNTCIVASSLLAFIGRTGASGPVSRSSNHTSQMPLEFVHITKTAGSAIEEAAARSGVKWGVCHFKRVNKFGPSCMYKDRNIARPAYDRNAIPFRFKGTLGEPWHTPPHWFRQNPYNNTKTFCVVRNPYDRIVSEYYSKFGGYKGNDRNNATVMNRWIQKQLSPRIQRRLHRLPQHMYVFSIMGKKIIDHVLHFESLDEDFTALMEQYKISIDLPKRVNERNTTVSTLTTANFTDETIRVINAYYADDFILFNYTMF